MFEKKNIFISKKMIQKQKASQVQTYHQLIS